MFKVQYMLCQITTIPNKVSEMLLVGLTKLFSVKQYYKTNLLCYYKQLHAVGLRQHENKSNIHLY